MSESNVSTTGSDMGKSHGDDFYSTNSGDAVDNVSIELSTESTDQNVQSNANEASEEPTVTLDEVIEAHEELEAEAEALLGGENADACTYPEGYKPRQPLYSCRTCANGPAALCYGCSVSCHDGHELFELYTKRNICCDCGNSKFKNACTLFKEKKPLNERNTYNHNFDGLYCVCNRPYPCEEYEDSEMLQCIICEDWLHLQHLVDNIESVDASDVEEVICRNCVSRINFLTFYADKTYVEDCESNSCGLKWLMENVKVDEMNKVRSLFFNSYEWRNRLCKCEDCMQRYEDEKVYFLVDLTDTLHSYVNSHSNKNEDEQPENMNAAMTNALIDVAGREGAIVLYQGYEEMKKKLEVRLKRIADEKKEVKKEDIYDFFQELESERKRRRENSPK